MQNKVPSSLIQKFNATNTFLYHVKKSFSTAKATKLIELNNRDDRHKLQDTLLGQKDNGVKLDIEESSEFLIQDTESSKKSKSGQILAFNFGKDTELWHGDYGISTSNNNPKPENLLKHKLILPKNYFTAIDIRKNTVFFPEKHKDLFLIGNPEQIYEVLPVEEKKKQGSLTMVTEFLPDVAEAASAELRHKILRNPKKEKFFEETTLPIIKPTSHTKSSQTLMDFSEKQEETTAMHYHPGERELIIFTTDKPAGVVLNFCGIMENPDEHPECEKQFEFPPNSMVVLKFPPYTHHKFLGSFVCTSVHPREGKNIIEAVQSGNIKGGFLESATVMSKMGQYTQIVENSTNNTNVKWQNNDMSGDKRLKITTPSF